MKKKPDKRIKKKKEEKKSVKEKREKSYEFDRADNDGPIGVPDGVKAQYV